MASKKKSDGQGEGLMTKVAEKIRGAVGTVQGTAEVAVETAKEATGAVIQKAQQTAGGASEAAQDGASAIAEKASDIAKGAPKVVKTVEKDAMGLEKQIVREAKKQRCHAGKADGQGNGLGKETLGGSNQSAKTRSQVCQS